MDPETDVPGAPVAPVAPAEAESPEPPADAAATVPAVVAVVVTHDPGMGSRARRQVRMEDGAIVADGAP